jgi:small ubiquitin-related modifier
VKWQLTTLAMDNEKPKEGIKTENDHSNLQVAGQNGPVVQFKRHTPLSKTMKAHCEQQGLSMRQIRFQFDEMDTPALLELEDVLQQHTGGVY